MLIFKGHSTGKIVQSFLRMLLLLTAQIQNVTLILYFYFCIFNWKKGLYNLKVASTELALFFKIENNVILNISANWHSILLEC